MSRDLNLYLQDICTCINKIEDYVGNMGYSDLIEDSKTLDADRRSIQVLCPSTYLLKLCLRCCSCVALATN
jgi:uncharacterized protein with HEPN domain